MIKPIIYILFVSILFSCARQGDNNANTQENKVATEVTSAEEAKDINTESNDSKKKNNLEQIISFKLQEIYDLNNIISDSTIDQEIRIEANISLQKLLVETKNFEHTNKGLVKNVNLKNEDYITFEIDNETKEAQVSISKNDITIEGKVIENLEIKIEEIK